MRSVVNNLQEVAKFSASEGVDENSDKFFISFAKVTWNQSRKSIVIEESILYQTKVLIKVVSFLCCKIKIQQLLDSLLIFVRQILVLKTL